MAKYRCEITGITTSMKDYGIDRYEELVQFGHGLHPVAPLADIATASYNADLGTLTLTFRRPLTKKEWREIRRNIKRG